MNFFYKYTVFFTCCSDSLLHLWKVNHTHWKQEREMGRFKPSLEKKGSVWI